MAFLCHKTGIATCCNLSYNVRQSINNRTHLPHILNGRFGFWHGKFQKRCSTNIWIFCLQKIHFFRGLTIEASEMLDFFIHILFSLKRCFQSAFFASKFINIVNFIAQFLMSHVKSISAKDDFKRALRLPHHLFVRNNLNVNIVSGNKGLLHLLHIGSFSIGNNEKRIDRLNNVPMLNFVALRLFSIRFIIFPIQIFKISSSSRAHKEWDRMHSTYIKLYIYILCISYFASNEMIFDSRTLSYLPLFSVYTKLFSFLSQKQFHSFQHNLWMSIDESKINHIAAAIYFSRYS